LGIGVDSLYMLAETDCAVESSIAWLVGDRVDVCTWKGDEFKVVGADMALEGLMLAESLVAGGIAYTSKSLVAFMSLLMSSKSRTSQETFVAALPITNPFALLSMRALDVLLQMLILDISLVATLIRAWKWTLIGMRYKMRFHSGRPIEGLGASWESA
jgi:hypothetical protein